MSAIPSKENMLRVRFESMLKTQKELYFDACEFEEIIMHYLDHGKKSLAKKALKLGLKQHKDSISLRLLKAELLVLENKLMRASNILQQLNAIEPNNEEIYIQQASIFSKQMQHQKAIEYLKYALSFEEESEAEEILSLIAMEYLYLEDYANAVTYFKKCIEIYPKDIDSLNHMIYCYDAQGEHKKAISYLNSYIDEMDPYSHTAWLQLGKQYYAIESFEKALNAFNYAVLINERSLASYIEKAKTLEKLGRYKEAIDSYKKSFKIASPTTFSLLRVGKCYEKLSMYQTALQYYKAAAHEDPLLDKAWSSIADVYLKNNNNSKEALIAIKKALDADHLNPEYWIKYAKANLYLNMYEEAVIGFSRSIDLKNHQLETFLGLFDVLYIIGDYREALLVLQNAKQQHANSVEIEYRLSGIHFVLNNKKIGKEILINALSTDFDRKYILGLLFPKIYNSSKIQKLISEVEKKI